MENWQSGWYRRSRLTLQPHGYIAAAIVFPRRRALKRRCRPPHQVYFCALEVLSTSGSPAENAPRRRARARGSVVSRFTQTMYDNARSSLQGMVTGEPDAPVRHTWGQVHKRARRVAGGLAAAGVGRGDAVAVLAGAPVEIAPTAQAIWMRGASVTMLHQPTLRTDLLRWADETMAVIDMIDARAVVISEPFMAAAPLLSQLGM